MPDIARYDEWLKDTGPAALVLREHLIPVEGPDGVLFPATFAAAEDKSKFAGGYNIDVFPDDKDVGPTVAAMLKDGRLKPTIDLFPNSKNVCLVDSVGSQANRIEPMFLPDRYEGKYAGLVPQIVIKAGDKSINLLEAGHRAGDAIVRCTELKNNLQSAFRDVLRGNAEPLARIAPTSLVFGVWDSRDTQAKLPRLVSSTIRAFDVRKLSRSANYLVQQQIDYGKDGIIPEWHPDALTDADKDKLSKKGFLNALASATHGGVIATGGVRRDATLSLAALRLLAVREADGTLSANRTQALRRYILGLALVAQTAPQSAYLRQGCNLVPDIDKPREFKLVHADGTREDVKLPHADALAFATAAAAAFTIGESGTYQFDKKLAEQETTGASEKVKGEIAAVDAGARKFTLRPGKNKPDVEVTTTDATVFLKKKEESTFEAVVVAKAKVEVELAGGVAAKVAGK